MLNSNQTAFIVRLSAHPGKREELKKLACLLFEDLSVEAEFVNATVHDVTDSPDEFLAYEVWNESRADYMQRLQSL